MIQKAIFFVLPARSPVATRTGGHAAPWPYANIRPGRADSTHYRTPAPTAAERRRQTAEAETVAVSSTGAATSLPPRQIAGVVSSASRASPVARQSGSRASPRGPERADRRDARPRPAAAPRVASARPRCRARAAPARHPGGLAPDRHRCPSGRSTQPCSVSPCPTRPAAITASAASSRGQPRPVARPVTQPSAPASSRSPISAGASASAAPRSRRRRRPGLDQRPPGQLGGRPSSAARARAIAAAVAASRSGPSPSGARSGSAARARTRSKRPSALLGSSAQATPAGQPRRAAPPAAPRAAAAARRGPRRSAPAPSPRARRPPSRGRAAGRSPPDRRGVWPSATAPTPASRAHRAISRRRASRARACRSPCRPRRTAQASTSWGSHARGTERRHRRGLGRARAAARGRR